MDLKEKAKLISINSREKVLNYLEGIHKTFVFGEEDDLKNIREYTYGDDIRKINWIITARERKPYIVEREEIKSQNIRLILLLDQEFLFKNKLEKLIETFSLLGYAALFKQDKLEVYILTDKVEKSFKVKNIHQIEQISEFIASLNLKEKKFSPKTAEKIAYGRRSFTIFIGDFIYEINLLPISYQHKLAVLIIRDLEEENPQNYVSYQLRSFDERRKIPFLRKDMVDVYKKNLLRLDTKLKTFLVNKKIPYTKIYTHQDPFEKLKRLFS
ncbi:MAG: DUF58 domain-containing protein [Aquificae bacterium]|nr:DUF58 domain-containing protein [Aquificota bacterium]